MKAITMKLTNNEIYNYAVALMNNLTNRDVYMPAAVAFSIEKNKTLLTSMAEDIEKSRINIIQHYSEEIVDGEARIPQENIATANQELTDLLNIEQDVKVYTFKIDEIADVKFTSAQMQTIMFMINEE